MELSVTSRHRLRRSWFLLLLLALGRWGLGQGAVDRMALATDFALVELNTAGHAAAWETVRALEAAGGRIAVRQGPYLLGWLPFGTQAAQAAAPAVRQVHQAEIPLLTPDFGDAESTAHYALLHYFNEVVSGRWASRPLPPTPAQPPSPTCHPTHPQRSAHGANLNAFGTHCDHEANSEYMTGSVTLSAFFLESNGAIDPNLYNWSGPAQTQIMNEITDAAVIWSYTSGFYSVSSLTFNLVWFTGAPATTGYEPVTRPSTDEALWVNAVMNGQGYSSPNHFTNVHAFNYAQRSAQGSQWAYTAFIAYNGGGAPITFTDGFSAYAWPGGPFTQLLYRNGGWAVNQFHRVFGHETAHIFHGIDEYSSSPVSNCAASFNGIQNTNYHGSTCNGSANCIMVANSYTGSGTTRRWDLCTATPSHIGWQNLTPQATPTSPMHNAFVGAGQVTFTWNRNTTNASIDSWIKIVNLNTQAESCVNVGASSSYATTLGLGNYAWTVINGRDHLSAGWAQVESATPYLLNVSPPDLVAGNLAIVVQPIVMGDTFSSTATVTNMSPVTVAGSWAGLYLSTDPVWSAGDVLLREDSIAPLAAGAAQVAHFGVTMPWNIPCGTYFLIAVADHRSQVTELNESNNATSLFALVTPPHPPGVMASQSTVCVGDTTHLSAIGAHGTVYWFGNSCGAILLGTGPTLPVAPTVPTTYYVRMDTAGCVSACAQITIGTQPPPVAGFTQSTTSMTVTFTDQSVGATSWTWDFGDGSSSGQQNPVHSYASAGTYTVTQTAMAANGCDDVHSTNVTVPIVGLEPEIPGMTVLLAPHPADASAHLYLQGPYNGPVRIQVRDAAGRLIRSRQFGKTQADERLPAGLQGLAPGMYFLVVSTDAGSQILKAIVH